MRQVHAFEASLLPRSTEMLSEAERALGKRLETLGGHLHDVLDGLETLPLDPTEPLTFSCLSEEGKASYVDALVKLIKGQGFMNLLEQGLLYHTACLHYSLKPKMFASSSTTDPLQLKTLERMNESSLIDLFRRTKDLTLTAH